MERKWNWLLKFLIADDGQNPNGIEIHVNNERVVTEKLVKVMQSLHPKHSQPMVTYYWEDKPRDAMMAQNLYHGRMALWAALRWPGEFGIKELRELVNVGD